MTFECHSRKEVTGGVLVTATSKHHTKMPYFKCKFNFKVLLIAVSICFVLTKHISPMKRFTKVIIYIYLICFIQVGWFFCLGFFIVLFWVFLIFVYADTYIFIHLQRLLGYHRNTVLPIVLGLLFFFSM